MAKNKKQETGTEENTETPKKKGKLVGDPMVILEE